MMLIYQLMEVELFSKKYGKKENNLMEKIVSLCKRRGFFFRFRNIRGLAGTYDWGHFGVALKIMLSNIGGKNL